VYYGADADTRAAAISRSSASRESDIGQGAVLCKAEFAWLAQFVSIGIADLVVAGVSFVLRREIPHRGRCEISER
jgi:hypothetical protein